MDMSIEDRVKTVLSREAMVGRKPADIGTDAKLIGELGLDSIQIVELLGGLEDEFGISLEDEELSMELFESVRSLAAFIRRRVQADETRT